MQVGHGSSTQDWQGEWFSAVEHPTRPISSVALQAQAWGLRSHTNRAPESYDSSTCGLALYSKNRFDGFLRFSSAFVSIPKDFLLCQTTRTIMASSDSSAKDFRLLDVRWPDNPETIRKSSSVM